MNDKLSDPTLQEQIIIFCQRLRDDGLDSATLGFLERLANTEVAALEQRVERLEGALMQTMAQNPECPLCRNGMEYRTSELGWWRLNHKDSCAWAKALAKEEACLKL